MDWDNFFFSDVGKKIKKIIRLCFYIETVLILIAGVVLEIAALVNLIMEGDGVFFLIMLGVPVGAALAIGTLWLSTLLTYGFAEIVDTAIINRHEQKRASLKNESTFAETEDEEEVTKKYWICKCGMKNPESVASCKGCSTSRSRAVATVAGDVTTAGGDGYKKCACGAMVKQGEKCPLCGKMVY